MNTDPTSLAGIAAQIPEDEDLASGLALSSSKKPSQMALLKDYCGLLSSADNPTPTGRAASFLSFTGSKVQVEFDIVCARLRRRTLEAVTREKHGDDGVRIFSLLLQTGKMDEKQVGGGPSLWLRGVRLGQLVVDNSFPDLQGGNDGAEGRPAAIVRDGGRLDRQPAGGAQKRRSESRPNVLPVVSSLVDGHRL